MADKKTLLESLRIDDDARDDGVSSGWSGLFVVVVAVLALAVGTAGGWFLAARLGEGDERVPPASETGAVAPDSATVPADSAAAEGGPRAARAVAEDAEFAPAPKPSLNASGYVVARRMATVSAEITGRLVAILVEEGQKVAAGEVVARLDDTLARTALRLAEAQVAAARARADALRAQLAEARRELARKKALRAQGFAPEADVTRAEAEVQRLEGELAAARAQVQVADEQVADARERVDKHVIRAPFAGVVVNKAAQPGEIVSPVSAGGGFTRTGICTIVDMASLEVEVDVAESYIARIVPGMRAQARLDAYPDWAIPAHVLAVIPTADRSKATVRVRVGLDERDSRILPEMGANVSFFED